MFGKKTLTPKEQGRAVKKEIRHNERDLERELWNLEREETKLIAEIKKEAAKGTSQRAVKALAGNLVQLRNQKDRLLTMKAHVSGVGHKASLMASQAALGQAVGGVTKVMGKMNVDAKKTAQTMQEFARQMEMSSVKEEMLDDALMDAFDGEGVEEEAEDVVSQVLQELALDTGHQMADAPRGRLPAKAQATSVSESEEDAAALKALEALLPPASGT